MAIMAITWSSRSTISSEGFVDLVTRYDGHQNLSYKKPTRNPCGFRASRRLPITSLRRDSGADLSASANSVAITMPAHRRENGVGMHAGHCTEKSGAQL